MDFASRSGLVKRIIITVVAEYSGKNWPKENKKNHIILNYTELYLEFETEFMSFISQQMLPNEKI